jgi:hypothetical protein
MVGVGALAWSAAWSVGWLVAACRVEFEVSDDRVVDEHGCVEVVGDDVGVFAGVHGADVDAAGADVDGAAGGHVGVVEVLAFRGEHGVFEGCCGGLGGGGGGEAVVGCLAADALVGAFVVVGVAEPVELVLELVDVGGEGLSAEPLFEGLLEAFDLAGGLGVERSPGDRPDAGVAQVRFELDLDLAEEVSDGLCKRCGSVP